jgi:hypothetical protein
MPMFSDDDLDLATLSEEELAAAWDLWFDLAQTTNDSDPPGRTGCFRRSSPRGRPRPPERSRRGMHRLSRRSSSPCCPGA